jgi:hypothetical protein
MAMYAPIPEDDLETPRRAAIPEAPVTARPLPRRDAPPAAPQTAPSPAPRQALPTGGGDDSSWIPPDELERQNIAAHKELGKDYNPKRFVTTEFLPEIAKAARTTIEDMFGISSRGQAVQAERPDVVSLASGRGAATTQEIQAANKAVDPRSELSPSERSVARLNATWMYHLEKGDPAGAKTAAAQQVLYLKKMLSQLSAVGQVAIENNDMPGLARVLTRAYDEVPDGQRLEAKPTKDGLDLTLVDDATGKLTELGEQGLDMLMEILTGLGNGTTLFRAIGALEQRDEVDPLKRREREVKADELEVRARTAQEKLNPPAPPEGAEAVFAQLGDNFNKAIGNRTISANDFKELEGLFEESGAAWEGATGEQKDQLMQTAAMLRLGNRLIPPAQAVNYAYEMYAVDKGEDGTKEVKPNVRIEGGQIRIGNSPPLNADPEFVLRALDTLGVELNKQRDNHPAPPRPDRSEPVVPERSAYDQSIIDRETGNAAPREGAATVRRRGRDNTDHIPLGDVPGIIGDAARGAAGRLGEAIGSTGPTPRNQGRADARERGRLMGQLRTLNPDLTVEQVRAMSVEQLRAEIERLGGER